MLRLTLLTLAATASVTAFYNANNTCGPNVGGATCDPTAPKASNPKGGACCSSAGYCGSTPPYCGANCNPKYGLCYGASAPATKSGSLYSVSNAGGFTTFQNYTFPGTTLPSAFQKSSYFVDDGGAPYNHTFVPGNVAVSGGFLRISVPGGQTKSPIQCGEVVTNVQNILYASVRTYAIYSNVSGTVQGNFFYEADSQEIDIEYLSDPNSESNPGRGKPPTMQYTNQALDGNPDDATFFAGVAPLNPYTAVHEYRIDWVKGKSLFYLDGVLQATFTTNVPFKAGPWVWNDWSNGDPGFTVGPPKTTNTFLIKNIVMYYNTTG